MLFRSILSGAMAVTWVAVGISAQAATRTMTGNLHYTNPSVAGGFTTERGPYPFGTKMTAVVDTGPGATLMIPANQVAPMSVMQFRLFPAFPTVAQQSATFFSTQNAATFMDGDGAAAGGDISWCPAAGNAGPGNSACTFFLTPGPGNLPIRIGINNTKPGAPKFGGTLNVIRNSANSLVWFVAVLPTSMNPIAQVSAQPNSLPHVAWTPGLPNYQFVPDVNDPGPNYTATLTASGGIGHLGNFVSTPPASDPRFLDGEGWGFKMTTGTISGSDIFPQTVGTPMHFFFTRHGTDMRVPATSGGETGNIVLVGGALASSPSSGNLFERVATFTINVPEPGNLMGLGAGVVGLLGLAAARRRIA